MSNEHGDYQIIKFRDRNQLKKRFEHAKIELMENGRKPANADVLEHLLDEAGIHERR